MEGQAFIDRRTARRLDRRAAIIRMAERQFLERGFAETSMSTIAAELGGSKTTLWSHFPSKDMLFLAVLDTMITGFAAELDEALVPAGGTAGALGRFGRVFLAKILSPDSVALKRMLAAESQRFPAMCEAYYQRGPGRVRERLARFMREEMDGERLREGDALLAGRQFLALLQAGAYNDRQWHRPVIETDIGRDVSTAIDTFLRAWGRVGS